MIDSQADGREKAAGHADPRLAALGREVYQGGGILLNMRGSVFPWYRVPLAGLRELLSPPVS